ncbi:DUF4913 domain-containing protein [Rothia uropygialis]|uniref:DUF4913 domain-containing protein n=1 Tax=Kocuria sp. 36 TaxID=1415402 RepID=UPI00101C48DA|nr:DUF4913 domain-containing protein [Kocuria sp. 36]
MSIIEQDASGAATRSCPEWWKHPEAAARMRALHVAYIQASAANELSGWWVHHWDAHHRWLFDASTGIFRVCGYSHREHRQRQIREEVSSSFPDNLPRILNEYGGGNDFRLRALGYLNAHRT